MALSLLPRAGACACSPGFTGTPLHWGQWEGNGVHRPGHLNVSVFPVLAKAAVAFFIRGRGGQAGSEAFGGHCRGLVRKPDAGRGENPGQREMQPSPRAPPLAARPPLPGAVVLVPRAAAVGEEADATQDGEQGGAPAQVEGGAQLVPGDKDDEKVVLAQGGAEAHPLPP